jgi:hypothetical protein
MSVDKQKLLPIGGMNLDSDEQFVPETQATFIKNHINAVNNLEDGNSGGQSTNALTPYPSISTNFDEALFPHLRSYTIDLSSVTFPSVFVSFVRDTTEVDVGNNMANSAALDAIMMGSGFTITGAQTYSITDSTFIWQKIIWRLNANAYYESVLFDLDPTQGIINGTNICIGSYYDLKLNQMIWFNYNTANRHNIQLYNATLDTYTTVLETPLLNLNYNYRISSIDLVQAIVQTDEGANPLERLLYWTDKYNAPRKINIDRAIGNEYWNHSNYLNYFTDDEFMCRVKYPPHTTIKGNILDDLSAITSYVDNNSYQFRQNFVFDDGEESKWGFISSLMIMRATNGNVFFNNQYIHLTGIDVGSSIVNKINLAFRVGNTGDWKQFLTIQRSDWLSNTNIATYIDSYTTLTVKYDFKNEYAFEILDQAKVDLLFDKVPLKSGCQEFLDNNILADGDILTDYDNLSIDDISKCTIDLTYPNSFNNLTPTINEVLKGGGTYSLGFILYDAANRSTYVQGGANMNLYINTIMENNGYKFQKIVFNFNGLTFPSWVKNVSICRTQNTTINRTLEKGFIQWSVSSVEYLDNNNAAAAIGVATKVRVKTQGLTTFNTNNLEATSTAYQWVDGDKITILTSNSILVPTATYGVITMGVNSVDSETFTFDMDSRLVQLNTAGNQFQLGDFIQLWTPNKTDPKTKIYYEITKPIPVDQSTHLSTIPSVTLSTGTGLPAVFGTGSTFDTFYIYRVAYSQTTIAPTVMTGTFESPSFCDTISDSQGEDIGRINVVNENAGQLWYPSLVRYSMPYVQDTFINGLSTFDSGREKTFFRQYGNITRMYCEQFNLCLIQEEKAFRVMVNRNLITSSTGDNTVTLTTDILSDAIEIQGNFGCQNGETFIGRQGMLYWWDLKRGAFVGGNFERVEDISALYDKDGNATGVQTYALKQSKAIFNNNSDRSSTYTIFIHAGFDPKLNQIIFSNWKKDFRISPSFQPTFYNNFDNWSVLTNDTVAFRTSGKWDAFLSFTPEMYSMCEGHRLGNALVSFKEGAPYFHNLNNETTYLNFYGTTCDKYLEIVGNKGETVKNWMNISVDSKNKSVTLTGTKYSGVTVQTSNNMQSTIPLPSFVQREGAWFSNFYRNTSLGKTIITGEQLKGSWCKIKLKGDATKNSEYSELRGVTVLFNESKYTV